MRRDHQFFFWRCQGIEANKSYLTHALLVHPLRQCLLKVTIAHGRAEQLARRPQAFCG